MNKKKREDCDTNYESKVEKTIWNEVKRKKYTNKKININKWILEQKKNTIVILVDMMICFTTTEKM